VEEKKGGGRLVTQEIWGSIDTGFFQRKILGSGYLEYKVTRKKGSSGGVGDISRIFYH